MLTEKEVEYVLTIADCRNISRAAEKLHIAQSALSRSLRQIEDSLGVTLFDRSSTPISLTHAGRRYIFYAKKYQGLVRDMQRELLQISHQDQGNLVLGIPSQIANYIFPQNITEFINQYPSINISMKYDSTRVLSDMLRRNRINVSILSSPILQSDYRNDVIAYDRILFAIPSSYNLEDCLSPSPYENISYVDLEAISEKRFFVTEYFYQSSVSHLLDTLNIYLPQTTFVPNLNVAWDLASNSNGIAIIMHSMLQHTEVSESMIYCTVDVSEATMHYMLSYRVSEYNSNKSLKLFVDHCQESFTEYKI